jgi:DNA-damage-inducible protein D
LGENKVSAKKGGAIAKNAKLELEEKTGKRVVSKDNFKQINNKKVLN